MNLPLLDTSILSIYVESKAEERSPKVVRLVNEQLLAHGLFISSITKYELRRGVRKLRLRGEGRRKEVAVERLLDAAHLFSPDAAGGEVWNVAADLWAKAELQGLAIADADLIIASTAVVHDMSFVTSDARLVRSLERVGFTADIALVDRK